MISVIVPSFKDPYLPKTINSLLENAQGDIEILAILDGYTPKIPLPDDPRLHVVALPQNLGMRGAINIGLALAQGKYVMKCDAHCVFAPGFDTAITENMEDDWLVIPRRYGLHADDWTRTTQFPPKDYHYLSYPIESKGFGKAMFPFEWKEPRISRQDFLLDDTMTFQGSCYVAHRKFFLKRVGTLDDRIEAYTPFGGEQIEVGLKYWLGGGQVKVNKNTWYAHLYKNARHYKEVPGDSRKYKVGPIPASGRQWATKHWLNNEEPNMMHPFSWLVEKFWPVPTWPENRDLWRLI